MNKKSDQNAVNERIRRVVASVFGVPESAITAQSSNQTIPDWDSLNIINLMIAIESEFGITLSVDEATDLLSVQKIQALLQAKGIIQSSRQ
jgi:acyl carrier protein